MPKDIGLLPQLALEPTHAALKVKGSYRAQQMRVLARLNPRQSALFHVWTFHGAVCNGGFYLVFDSSYGDSMPQIRHSLREIGALKHLAILDRAIAQLTGEYCTDFRERQNQLNLLSAEGGEALERMAGEYYQLEDRKPDVLSIAADYIATHPDDFFR